MKVARYKLWVPECIVLSSIIYLARSLFLPEEWELINSPTAGTAGGNWAYLDQGPGTCRWHELVQVAAHCVWHLAWPWPQNDNDDDCDGNDYYDASAAAAADDDDDDNGDDEDEDDDVDDAGSFSFIKSFFHGSSFAH